MIEAAIGFVLGLQIANEHSTKVAALWGDRHGHYATTANPVDAACSWAW
jgi:hypothetical protein